MHWVSLGLRWIDQRRERPAWLSRSTSSRQRLTLNETGGATLARQTLRTSLWLFGAALGLITQSVHAQIPAGSVPVKTYTGYYNDRAVYFTALETNDANFAAANGLMLAPRMSQMNAGNLPRMLFFMNAGGRQTVVLETQPGQPTYNPFWQVWMAFWNSGDAMPLITSWDQARQLNQQAKLAVQETGIIFNGPVLRINRPLDLSTIGDLAPTISPNEFMGIDPAARTAFILGHQGYYNGVFATFLALEHDTGQISHAPGAIPVTTIGIDRLSHNGAANFYVFEGQPPVLDSAPIRQVAVQPGTTTPPTSVAGGSTGGTTGGTVGGGIYGAPAAAGQPVSGAGAGQTGQTPAVQPASSAQAFEGQYSPLWHVHAVVFNTAATPGVPRPIFRSLAEIKQAAAAGVVSILDGRADDTFNCPVPFFYTAGAANGIPFYTPPVGAGSNIINPGVTTNPVAPATPAPVGGGTGGGIY
jgi:hypothetical protein